MPYTQVKAQIQLSVDLAVHKAINKLADETGGTFASTARALLLFALDQKAPGWRDNG